MCWKRALAVLGRRLLVHSLIVTLASAGAGAGAGPVRVDVSSTSLLADSEHAWIIVNLDAFLAEFAKNFSSCNNTMDWQDLQWSSTAVTYSQGCWKTQLSYGASSYRRLEAMGMDDPSCRTPTDEAIFLQQGHTYAVCGISYWNNFFGQMGAVSIRVSESSEALVAFDSAAALNDNPTGVAPPACIDRGERSCIFELAKICVECATVDCAAASESFCASLNRQPCRVMPNTCGACDECFLVESDLYAGGGVEHASGTETGSGGFLSDDSMGSGSGASESMSSGGDSVTGGNSACIAVSEGSVLPPPVLATSGAANPIGPSGATGTTIRIQWRKPDCDSVRRFAVRLRERRTDGLAGPWVVAYQGHPGGGFSRSESLSVHIQRTGSEGSPPAPSIGVGGAAGIQKRRLHHGPPHQLRALQDSKGSDRGTFGGGEGGGDEEQVQPSPTPSMGSKGGGGMPGSEGGREDEPGLGPGVSFDEGSSFLTPPSPPAASMVTANDASMSAQLLGSSGDLYFSVMHGGEGYNANSTAVHLNASSIATGAARAPMLTVVIDGSTLTGVSIPCQPSEITTLTPPGCAQTLNYGRLGEFEYTQGSLMYDTEYDFAVDAMSSITGAWRGWSQSTQIRTLGAAAETASVATTDPACDAGITLPARSGVLAKVVKRAVVSSTCVWRLSPADLQVSTTAADTAASSSTQKLFVSFEPSSVGDEVGSNDLFSVGNTLFSPLRAEDVTLTVFDGVTRVVVVDAGHSCETGDGSGHLNVVFDPNTFGVEAEAYISNGAVTNVYVINGGSGLSASTTLAASIDGTTCVGVVLEVEIGGLSPPYLDSQGQGYTSLPTVTLEGGSGATGFVPAEMYAEAMDTSNPNELSLNFRWKCETQEGSGSVNDQCDCAEAQGNMARAPKS